MDGESAAASRAGARLSSWLMAAMTVVWAVSGAVYLLHRDPYLGYLSDPAVGRTIVFIVLPGAGWLLTVALAVVTRLSRTPVLSWLVIGVGVPFVVGLSWIPVGAMIRHLV